MVDNRDFTKKVEDKYYREIELTVKRMYEFTHRLSLEEVMDAKYTLEPRNKVELALKEDVMAYIRQRFLEGYRPEVARSMALVCAEKSLSMLKERVNKERGKKK